MSHSEEGVRNGHIQIHVSSDRMAADIDLFPPASGGEGFTVLSVVTELEAAGVTWGVDRGLLEKKILDSLENEKVVRGVPAARGQKPQKSVPPYWHLKKRLIASPDPDPDATSVDYREHSPYILVKKGEPLAKMVPASPGVPGRNTAGEVIPAESKDVVQYKPGEHTIEKDGILYAACHGRFEIRERLMSVNETLDIPGNVDYSTGHIAFPGDVIIHGSVCDGFQVASGKSIFVKQTMDASRVLSHGDLVVEGGIKGRQDALVHVDGRVSAKFVENARIETRGDVVVEKAVMHSQIFTLNHLDLGEAGSLVGGETWAMNGLRAGRIGRPESPASQIRVGTDYTADRKLRSAREQIDRLEAKLEKLRSRTSLNEEKRKLIDQVEGVLAKLEKTKNTLLEGQYRNRQARVIVFSEVLEGTDIHICELSLRINSPMDGVVFYYDSEGPRIASRAITDRDKGPFVTEAPAADSASGNGNKGASGPDPEGKKDSSGTETISDSDEKGNGGDRSAGTGDVESEEAAAPTDGKDQSST